MICQSLRGGSLSAPRLKLIGSHGLTYHLLKKAHIYSPVRLQNKSCWLAIAQWSGPACWRGVVSWVVVTKARSPDQYELLSRRFWWPEVKQGETRKMVFTRFWPAKYLSKPLTLRTMHKISHYTFHRKSGCFSIGCLTWSRWVCALKPLRKFLRSTKALWVLWTQAPLDFNIRYLWTYLSNADLNIRWDAQYGVQILCSPERSCGFRVSFLLWVMVRLCSCLPSCIWSALIC